MWKGEQQEKNIYVLINISAWEDRKGKRGKLEVKSKREGKYKLQDTQSGFVKELVHIAENRASEMLTAQTLQIIF